MGWLKSNILSKDVLNMVKKMKIGEMSEPIVNSTNILFVKLLDKKNTSKEDLNINKLKSQVASNRQNELFQLYSNSFLSQIKNNSLIEYR